jgi:hypothetical protein
MAKMTVALLEKRIIVLEEQMTRALENKSTIDPKLPPGVARISDELFAESTSYGDIRLAYDSDMVDSTRIYAAEIPALIAYLNTKRKD